jgi:hypothetical protein
MVKRDYTLRQKCEIMERCLLSEGFYRIPIYYVDDVTGFPVGRWWDSLVQIWSGLGSVPKYSSEIERMILSYGFVDPDLYSESSFSERLSRVRDCMRDYGVEALNECFIDPSDKSRIGYWYALMCDLIARGDSECSLKRSQIAELKGLLFDSVRIIPGVSFEEMCNIFKKNYFFIGPKKCSESMKYPDTGISLGLWCKAIYMSLEGDSDVGLLSRYQLNLLGRVYFFDYLQNKK